MVSLRRQIREESARVADNERVHKREVGALKKELSQAENVSRTLQATLKKSQEKLKATEEKIDEMQQKLTRIADKAEEEKKKQEMKHNEVGNQDIFVFGLLSVILGSHITALDSVAWYTRSWPSRVGQAFEIGGNV